MPKSPFDNMPRELNLYMMSFFGRKKYLNAFAETCRYFNNLSKEKSLEKYFEPDFTRPGELQDFQLGDRAIALSNNYRTLAVVNTKDIELIDTQTSKIQARLRDAFKFTNESVNIHFMKDDKHLIVAYYRPNRYDIWLKKATLGNSRVDVWNLETLARVCSFQNLEDNDLKSSSPEIIVLDNNQFIISLFFQRGFQADHSLHRCDIAENTCVPLTENTKKLCCYSTAVSPNKKLIAQMIGKWQFSSARNLRVYNVEDGKLLKHFEIPQKSLEVRDPTIYFIDDATIIYAQGHYINHVDIETGNVKKFRVHDLKPDGQILNSMHVFKECIALKLVDTGMLLWDVQANKSLATLPFFANSMIWDDEHKNLIIHGIFDGIAEEVKFMHIPHRLEDKAEPVPERSSPRP